MLSFLKCPSGPVEAMWIGCFVVRLIPWCKLFGHQTEEKQINAAVVAVVVLLGAGWHIILKVPERATITCIK